MPDDPRVRPTSERVREAWMSILADRIPGARVLDLFAGSGALGLEALSRGAAECEFVELAPRSLAAIRANIAALGLEDRTRVKRADAMRYIPRLVAGAADLAFADPPYTHGHAAKLVQLFREVPFARVLSVEHSSDSNPGGDEIRRYGDIALTFCYAP